MGATNVYMTEEDRVAVERLAVALTNREKRPVSVSEAIRIAVREALRRKR